MPNPNELNDDLSDLIGEGKPFGVPTTMPDALRPRSQQARPEGPSPTPAVFFEACRKCGGSGRFVSFHGRTVGPCYTCKGTGKLTFRSSPEQRRAKRASNAASRARSADQSWAALAESAPEVATWLAANRATNDFAASLCSAVERFGSLTEGQSIAVQKWIARDAEREAERLARSQAAEVALAAAPVVDVSRIAEALNQANRNGLSEPKLRLGEFIFKLAKADSRNPGAIYVLHRTRPDARDATKKAYLGKIVDGRFVATEQCTPEDTAALIALAADPAAAAVRYGRQIGACACCGRQLVDPESVSRGIGPICAEKFGF